MALVLTTCSIIVQFCAAILALRLARKSGRRMLLPLALAILLMAVRRVYSIYGKLAFSRPIDMGAETIALVISLLMVIGLVGLWRWLDELSQPETEIPNGSQPRFWRSLPRIAIVLGLMSIVGSCAAGYFAYRQSRETILEGVYSSNLNLARSLKTFLQVSGSSKSPQANIELARSFWEQTSLADSPAYLCISKGDGKLLLNSNTPELEGNDIRDLSLESPKPGSPQTLGELLVAQKEWSGFFRSRSQQRQAMSVVFLERSGWMIAVHLPEAEVNSLIRAGAVPWASGYALMSLLFLPLSLGMLHWAYSTSFSQLGQSERRFRDLIDSAPDAMLIVNAEGSIVVVNSQTEQLFGYPREELLGQAIEILMPFRQRDAHVGQRHGYFANPTVRPMNSGLELFGLRKDQTEVPLEISLSPIETSEGRLVAASVRDMTGRRHMEQVLQARVQQLATIAELGHEALAGRELTSLMNTAVEKIARTLNVQLCKVLERIPDKEGLLLRSGVGWAEELIGVGMVPTGKDSQAGYTLHSSQPVIVKDLKAETRFAGTSLLHDHDVVSGVSVAIPGENGPWGVLCVHTKVKREFGTHDINFISSAANVLATVLERNRAEGQREQLIAELENKNAELERFTYTVSHDLKSPLVTIKGFLGVLRQDLQRNNEAAVEDDIDEIGGAADKMTQLLDELLELSRIGRIANPHEEVDLAEVVHEALRATAGPISARSAHVDVSGEFPVVAGDRVRLHEVLQNLISNAVKFSDERDPQIKIGVRHEAGEKVCFVQNNGTGIDLAYQEKVFGLFEQLDTSIEGSGIGLAIVKRIVEVHGGRIWVESFGATQGCTFCFVLPLPPSATTMGD